MPAGTEHKIVELRVVDQKLALLALSLRKVGS